MSKTGSGNYHIHKQERQAFHIDAKGVTGNIIAPELLATEVEISDLRDREVRVRFADDGISFLRLPTEVTAFDGADDWQTTYDRQLTAHLVRNLGAKKVGAFDHTTRVDDPSSSRRPARNVHNDYSREGAKNGLSMFSGAKRPSNRSPGGTHSSMSGARSRTRSSRLR